MLLLAKIVAKINIRVSQIKSSKTCLQRKKGPNFFLWTEVPFDTGTLTLDPRESRSTGL